MDGSLKPILAKMRRILSESPLMFNSYDALRLMLILTVLDHDETQADALSATFGRDKAKTLRSWISTLNAPLTLDADEFRTLVLSTVRCQAVQSSRMLEGNDCDMAGLLSEGEEMIRDALRLWLQTDEGKTHWRSRTFKNAVLLSLHVGDTSTFCSTVLGNVIASDARRLDECKTTVDDGMCDDDLLIRLIDHVSVDCNVYLSSLWEGTG